MKFRFQPEKSPRVSHRLASAEIVFDDLGVLLTGLAIWARKDGKTGLFVTFPAQRGKEGSEARYFDYVRSLDEKGAGVKRLKQAILEAFRKEHPQLAGGRQAAAANQPVEDYGY